MPALAEEDDPLGREFGSPLWPERYDVAALESIKRMVGTRVWNALYQQRPAPDEGAVLKRDWWRYWRTLPEFQTVIQSWDLTYSDGNASDYVCGQVWGKSGADLYLLDQVHARMSFTATIQAIRSMSGRWPQATAKLIENKANGAAAIDTLRHEIQGIIPVEPRGNKEARVNSVSPLIEAGNVYLPDSSLAAWVIPLVEETTSFPNGRHDDQVDALTQALGYLRQSTPLVTRNFTVEDPDESEHSPTWTIGRRLRAV